MFKMTGLQDKDIIAMRQEFRRRIETFYAELHLAPPYDSVEKALNHLTSALKVMPPEEQSALSARPDARLRAYTEAFAQAGLPQRHRGIIIRLIESGEVSLSADYHDWLALFGANRDRLQQRPEPMS
jgi:hypothetical protein